MQKTYIKGKKTDRRPEDGHSCYMYVMQATQQHVVNTASLFVHVQCIMFHILALKGGGSNPTPTLSNIEITCPI